MTNARLTIRPATPADLPSLYEIAERAVWSLLAGRHYTRRQMEAARAAKGYHVEPKLVEDGTYYVLETDGVLAGGSGWSGHSGFHPPFVGGASAELEPARGAAVMRASYVHPDWCRRGFGTLLARTTEAAATLSGFTTFEAMCTPASEALRRAMGYRLLRRTELPLIDGVSISMAHLRKDIGASPTARRSGTDQPGLAGADAPQCHPWSAATTASACPREASLPLQPPARIRPDARVATVKTNVAG